MGIATNNSEVVKRRDAGRVGRVCVDLTFSCRCVFHSFVDMFEFQLTVVSHEGKIFHDNERLRLHLSLDTTMGTLASQLLVSAAGSRSRATW